MGFSRQEYWSGLPCLPPQDLPNPGIEPTSLACPALAGRFFTTSATSPYWILSGGGINASTCCAHHCVGMNISTFSHIPLNLQGPCNLSQKWRGTLRFLSDLEIRPSSIAANPVESREASPSSIVSLTSQRHPEKLTEVTGTSRGNPGFSAATRERPRASFFIVLSPDSSTMTREQ